MAARAADRDALHPPTHAFAAAGILQRSVKIGKPGSQRSYDTGSRAALNVAIGVPLAAMPAWVAIWLPARLDGVVASSVAYEFDEPRDVIRWLILRELLADLETFMSAPAPPGGIARRGVWTRQAYAKLEASRTRFEQQGDLNGTFSLFGLTYHLQKLGAHHYYVSRPAGETVVYSGLPRGRAKAILQHLGRNGEDAPYDGKAEDVDDFVCAFFAEPTRWSPEKVLNILALTSTADETDVLTGSEGKHALPMAAGSTWEPQLGEIGRQTPRRALQHADSEFIWTIIEQELATSADFASLATAVKQQLLLLK